MWLWVDHVPETNSVIWFWKTKIFWKSQCMGMFLACEEPLCIEPLTRAHGFGRPLPL